MKPKPIITIALSGGLLVGTGFLVAGPLNPPAGPVISTHKTLGEVEPRTAINTTNTPGDSTCLFRITEPGSYFLTGDVAGVAGRDGIWIDAGGVTIDLMGFALIGIEESGTGIVTHLPFGDICVRNGAVMSWGGSGIEFAAGGRGHTLEGVRAASCGSYGIRVGDAALIRGCTAIYNAATGISAGESAVVENCAARNNGLNGIGASLGSALRSCATSQNGGAGLFVDSGGVASDCAAYSNGLHGILAVSGATVSRCSAFYNTSDGIAAGSNCLILENTCALNGRSGNGAGIHVLSVYCRVEGNHVTDNPRGIDVDGGRNFIVRNYATGNAANYDLAGGNIAGTIVTTEAQMNAAPNANINVSF